MLRRFIDPVAIVKVQHGCGRDGCVDVLLRAEEGGGGEHAEPQHAGILHFQANLGGAQVGIKDGPDIANPSLQNLVRIGVHAHVRKFAQAHKRQIVLVDVAQNPDVGKVGDGEGIGRCQALRSGRRRYLLVSNHSRGGSADFHNGRRVMGVSAQNPQVIERGFEGDFGFGFGVFGNLQIVLGNRPVFV